jgi:hypothetical protein
MSETLASVGHRALLTLICLFAFAVQLRARQQGDLTSPPVMIPQAEKRKLTSLLPGPPQFGGKPVKPPMFYSTDLYRYLDGGADAYLDYGLVALVHREFRSRDVDLAADIYDMGDALRAFGIYSAERAPDYAFLPIGDEGYADTGILNFLQGTYYVKLQAFGDNAGTPPAVLRAAAKNIAARIGPARGVPQPVDWFPAAGLVARSQRYIVKAPMGHPYLAPATTALYRFDGKETTVLASLAPTPAEAATRLGKLKEDLATYAKVHPFEGLPGEAWRTSNRDGRDIVFFSRGRYVVVVQDPPSQPEAFFKELYSSIKG